MTFEFEYDTETDQITIVYDGSCILKVDFDDERPVFRNFDKIGDEEIENVLKSLCRAAHNALS
jgi:hypothetical protein